METESEVAEFLERNAPRDLVEGLEILEELDLPVHDRHSFQQQLDEFAAQNEEDTPPAVETLAERFDAGDFPILSMQNAFEKYWDAYQPGPFLDDTILVEPPDPPGRPICEIYDEAFRRTPGAAECACRAYAEARRAGHSDVEAKVMGYGAGKTVRETGECPVPGVETSPFEREGPVWSGGPP